MTVEMHDVPVSCLAVKDLAAEPCVPHDERMPSLWYCSYIGLGGIYTTSPLRPHVAPIVAGGKELGLASRLDCPLPTKAKIAEITKYKFDGSTVTVNISVTYSAAHGKPGATAIVYDGVRGGNVLSFPSLAAPPPPTAPPPPVVPPPAYGFTQSAPAESCKQMASINAPDGYYWLSGYGKISPAIKVFCMTCSSAPCNGRETNG